MTDDAPTTFWGTVWARLRAWGSWAALHLLAPGVALLVVLGALALIVLGFKGIQIGGLLGKLLGKKDPEQKAIDVANTVPPHRVDPNGVLIPQGTPDAKGDTQAIVVPIEPTNVFTDPSTVTFTPPGADKPTVIQLPDGVRNSDVEHVIVMQPGKFVVTVTDNSGIPASTVDDLLRKYGG